MKKFVGFLIVIVLFAYIPIYSIWPIDYSSKTASILILLGEVQVIILENLANLIAIILPITLSLLNTIGALILDLSSLIVSLPYEKINPLYVIAGLFIIGYFFEKFRIINNDITKLNKKIAKQSELFSINKGLTSEDNDTQKPLIDHADDIRQLKNKADSIMKLLEEINSAADVFKSKNIRSKRARRRSAKDIEFTNSNNAIRDEKRAKDKEQLMRLRKDAESLVDQDEINDKANTASNNAIRDEKRAKDEEQLMRLRKDAESLVEQDEINGKANAADEIMNDENISQIDLARALIASGENEDAKNLLKRIVENDSEDQKHEARLLFMQLK
jgi:FimV-like protein